MKDYRFVHSENPWVEHACAIIKDFPEVVRTAFLIRRTELKILELFDKGLVHGTTHTSIGQELIAAACGRLIRCEDACFSTHRCHGHFLAAGGSVYSLFAEILGREDGACGGFGGSQHIHAGNFWSNGIVAGLMPAAVGGGLLRALHPSTGISVCFLGDGALAQGICHESMNFASAYKSGALFVIECNRYAQSTRLDSVLATSAERACGAFNLRCLVADVWRIGYLIEAMSNAFSLVRSGVPAAIVVNGYRLAPHSKGDDSRPEHELIDYWSRDVLNNLILSGNPDVLEIVHEVDVQIDDAATAAQRSPHSTMTVGSILSQDTRIAYRPIATSSESHADGIYVALQEFLNKDKNALILGEDIEAPYGGAFNITRDLSVRFPGRVLNCPISEACLVGVALGYAMRGNVAIVEIMFGDFITLAMDQLLNHASKLSDERMRGHPIRCIIRTPMGGYRGYGPTHSQSLERHLCGIPNVRVVALHGLSVRRQISQGICGFMPIYWYGQEA